MGKSYIPSETEIQVHCISFQANWDEREELRRRTHIAPDGQRCFASYEEAAEFNAVYPFKSSELSLYE